MSYYDYGQVPEAGWLPLGCKCCRCCVPCEGRVELVFGSSTTATEFTAPNCGRTVPFFIPPLVLQKINALLWSCSGTVPVVTGRVETAEWVFDAKLCCPEPDRCLSHCPKLTVSATYNEYLHGVLIDTFSICFGPLTMKTRECHLHDPQDVGGQCTWLATVDVGELAFDATNCACACTLRGNVGGVITARCFCGNQCPRTGMPESISAALDFAGILCSDLGGPYSFSLTQYDCGSIPAEAYNACTDCGYQWTGFVTLDNGCRIEVTMSCNPQDDALGVFVIVHGPPGDPTNACVATTQLEMESCGFNTLVPYQQGCDPWFLILNATGGSLTLGEPH